jgi:hypothetical protein
MLPDLFSILFAQHLDSFSGFMGGYLTKINRYKVAFLRLLGKIPGVEPNSSSLFLLPTITVHLRNSGQKLEIQTPNSVPVDAANISSSPNPIKEPSLLRWR